MIGLGSDKNQQDLCHLPKGLGRCFVLNKQEFLKEKCHRLKLYCYSNFPFKSSDKSVSLVFKFRPFGYFRRRGIVNGGKWSTMVQWRAAILSGDGANVPGVFLEVRICSPLLAGNTSCRCVVRLPPTPSSSTSKHPSCTNLFSEFLYIFL